MQKNLYIMIGAPGSGKSHFVSTHLKQKDAIWISRDAIRYSLVSEDEDYFSKEDEVVRTFIQYINEALSQESPYQYIYADATHLSKKSRKQLLSQLKIKPTSMVGIYFDLPLELIQQRNAQRTGRERVPAHIVEKMYRSMELPTKEEGFTDIMFVGQNNEIVRGMSL
jgi:predicted kinase